MGDFFGKKWKKLLAAALFAAGLLAAFRYALPLAAPFLLAFAVVHASAPLLERVHRRLAYPQGDFAGGAVCIRDRAFDRRALRLPFVGDAPCGKARGGRRGCAKAGGRGVKGLLRFSGRASGSPAKELEQDFSETWDALAGQLKKEALPKAVDRSVEGCRLLISAAGFIGIWMIASVLLCRDYEEIAEKDPKKRNWGKRSGSTQNGRFF